MEAKIPENWEDLPTFDEADSTVNHSSDKKVDDSTSSNHTGLSSVETTVSLGPCQTAYTPQVTRIMGRSQQSSSEKAILKKKEDEEEKFKEKQRKYQEARRRIFDSAK